MDNFAGMADSGVPFALGAENVPLVEDLNDIPVGQAVTIVVLMTGLLDDDAPTSMTLVCKADPDDSNVVPTTIIETITTTLAAAGILAATDDPTVWRGIFNLTRAQGVRLSSRSTYEYSVSASVTRDAVVYDRMIQRGALSVNLYPIEFDSPLADGSFYADGSLHADGFEN